MSTVPFQTGANATLQNRINISMVFNYLRVQGRSYRAQIARELALSAPAVSRAVDHLIEKGLVFEKGTVQGVVGKKAAGLEINGTKGCVIAIDAFKEHLKIAAVDFAGRTLIRSRGQRFAESKDVAGDLVGDIDRFLAYADFLSTRNEMDPLPPVTAISIGLPAAVDNETGAVRGAYLYHSLEGLDLCPILSERFGFEVHIENDVKLAALAENRVGEGTRHRNLVYLDVSDGIAAGIIVDNHILRGSHGFAGEIGYMLRSTSSLEYTPITKGYLEEHASVEAIRSQAIRAIKRGAKTMLEEECGDNHSSITGEAVFRSALRGDQLARALVKQSANLLTLAVLNTVLVVNPEVVVLGGDIYDLPGIDELILSPMREKLPTLVPFDPPDITLSSLGSDSCLIGAALLGIDSHLNVQYPFHFDSLNLRAANTRQVSFMDESGLARIDPSDGGMT